MSDELPDPFCAEPEKPKKEKKKLNWRQRKKMLTERDPYTAPADDGAPQQLQDIRHVYLNARRYDKTEGHRLYRSKINRNRNEFLKEMAALEQAWMRSKPKSQEAPAAAVQEEEYAEEESIKFVEEWLEKHG